MTRMPAQVRDDRLETVVVAAVAVHDDDRAVGVLRAVVPVAGGAAEHLDARARERGCARAGRRTESRRARVQF